MQYNAKDNDDFKNAKIFKIYQDLSYTRDVIYIGSTCDTLSKCMSNFRSKSKSRVNCSYDKFYMMIRNSYCNCKIELIENFPSILYFYINYKVLIPLLCLYIQY